MAKSRLWFPQMHCHDEYSIKDGCSSVETYADLVVERGGSSLAITNHGQASGWARQWFACKDRKIKAIFGIEAYINEDRARPIRLLVETLRKQNKKAKSKDTAIKTKLAKAEAFLKERFRPNGHAVLLAKTLEGYKNLVRMSTDSWMRGFYYVPRTDTAFLEEHAGSHRS